MKRVKGHEVGEAIAYIIMRSGKIGTRVLKIPVAGFLLEKDRVNDVEKVVGRDESFFENSVITFKGRVLLETDDLGQMGIDNIFSADDDQLTTLIKAIAMRKKQLTEVSDEAGSNKG